MGTFFRSLIIYGLGNSRNKFYKHSSSDAGGFSNGFCKSFHPTDNNHLHATSKLAHFRLANVYYKRSHAVTCSKTCGGIYNYGLCSGLARLNTAFCNQLLYQQGGLCSIKKDPITEVFLINN